METMAKTEAFFTLKDHNENFQNNPKCRLIKPAKPQLGRASKSSLDKINHDIRSKTRVNQWTNSSSVTQWFKSINSKKNITWAKQHTRIAGRDDPRHQESAKTLVVPLR